jgi:hypothetical protein
MTAVEQLGIAFRQWQKDWDSFEDTKKNKPVSFDEFIKPFLEIEKQQIIDAYKQAEDMYEFFEYEHRYGREYLTAEPYYNKTFKNNESN